MTRPATARMRSQVVFVNRFFAPDDTATSQLAGDVARDLARAGVRVATVTSRRILTSRTALLPAREDVDGVQVHRVWTSGLGRGLVARALDYGLFYLGVSWRLWRLLRRGDVVVAMTDPPLISVFAGWIARLRGARLVNWLQDVYPEVAVELGLFRRGTVHVRLMTALRNASLRRAEANVVLGQAMERHVLAAEPRAAQPTLIPNWFEELPPAVEPNPYRRELGLPDDAFVVGYAGNLGRAHRFDGLVEASRLLGDETPVHFLIIGEGAQRAALEQDVRRAGVKRWTFLDYQPRTRAGDFLRAIDLHVISLEPRLEGLIVPSKLYGVLAAGRPSVFLGRGDSEVAAILARERCGAALAPGDAGGLAALVRRLHIDDALRLQWGQRARVAYERRFSRTVAMSEWRSLVSALGVTE
jgi:colanic acid biosynthesis glycosyl transferase WcaI